MKECYPVQTAEFAVVEGFNHEPACNWLVMHVLKKRDRINASVRKWQRHKFGIDLPKTVKQALTLDAKNGKFPMGR